MKVLTQTHRKTWVYLVAISIALMLSGCGGDSDDGGSEESLGSTFTVVLSDNFDRCGSPVNQNVDISFTNINGNEITNTVEHTGLEETYSFTQNTSGRKLLRVNKIGGDTVIIDASPAESYYFSLDADVVSSCGCPLYNITLTDSEANSTDSSNLVIEGVEDSSSNGLWQNIEICEQQQSSVFVTNDVLQKFKKVEFSGSSSITVGTLDTMNTGTFNYEGVALMQVKFLDDHNNSGEIDPLFDYIDLSLSDNQLQYVNQSISSDTEIRLISFPSDINYVNMNSSFNGLFSSGSNPGPYQLFEHYVMRVPTSELSSTPEYNLLDIADLEMDVVDDFISLSSTTDIEFESSLFWVYGSGYDGILKIHAPVENNTVDLTRVQSIVENLGVNPSHINTFIYDNPGADTYDLSIQEVIKKEIRGDESRRSFLLLSTPGLQ